MGGSALAHIKCSDIKRSGDAAICAPGRSSEESEAGPENVILSQTHRI